MRPGGQFQLYRSRYEVGTVHLAGITELWKHRRPDTNLSSGGGVGADLPSDLAYIKQFP